MGAVFVDTSIWYAAADDSDAHNTAARSLLTEHAAALVTSDLVLAELWNLVNARVGHRAANQLVAAVRNRDRARRMRHRRRPRSSRSGPNGLRGSGILADRSHQLALMERLAITDALALDADFRIYRYGPDRRKAFTSAPSKAGPDPLGRPGWRCCRPQPRASEAGERAVTKGDGPRARRPALVRRYGDGPRSLSRSPLGARCPTASRWEPWSATSTW